MNPVLLKELYDRFSKGGYAEDVDLHVHTTFSDGKCTAEDMIVAAIDKGLSIIGFSDHSIIEGEWWTMTEAKESRYYETIMALKEKYKGKIDVYCGIEQDSLSKPAAPYYDYIIGSVHGVQKNGKITWADNSAEMTKEAVDGLYHGDYYAYAEDYFAEAGELYNKTKCDIIGHFDVLTKFNEDGKMFDIHHPRYVKAWKNAIDKLCERKLIFEINTGAIGKGYRTTPYPDEDMMNYIVAKGGILKINSDSHHITTLGYEFGKWSKRNAYHI